MWRSKSWRLALLMGLALATSVAGNASAAAVRTAAGVASTTSAQGNCNNGWVTLWENGSYGGSSLKVCYGDNISNLANVSAPSGCDGGVFIYPDWHDCISSFKVVNASCHIRLNLYVDANYGSIMPSPYSGLGSRSISSMGGYGDHLSSLRWSYNTTCPD